MFVSLKIRIGEAWLWIPIEINKTQYLILYQIVQHKLHLAENG